MQQYKESKYSFVSSVKHFNLHHFILIILKLVVTSQKQFT